MFSKGAHTGVEFGGETPMLRVCPTKGSGGMFPQKTFEKSHVLRLILRHFEPLHHVLVLPDRTKLFRENSKMNIWGGGGEGYPHCVNPWSVLCSSVRVWKSETACTHCSVIKAHSPAVWTIAGLFRHDGTRRILSGL